MKLKLHEMKWNKNENNYSTTGAFLARLQSDILFSGEPMTDNDHLVILLTKASEPSVKSLTQNTVYNKLII